MKKIDMIVPFFTLTIMAIGACAAILSMQISNIGHSIDGLAQQISKK